MLYLLVFAILVASCGFMFALKVGLIFLGFLIGLPILLGLLFTFVFMMISKNSRPKSTGWKE